MGVAARDRHRLRNGEARHVRARSAIFHLARMKNALSEMASTLMRGSSSIRFDRYRFTSINSPPPTVIPWTDTRPIRPVEIEPVESTPLILPIPAPHQQW